MRGFAWAAVAAHIKHEEIEQRPIGNLPIHATRLRWREAQRHELMKRAAAERGKQQRVFHFVAAVIERFAGPPVLHNLMRRSDSCQKPAARRAASPQVPGHEVASAESARKVHAVSDNWKKLKRRVCDSWITRRPAGSMDQGADHAAVLLAASSFRQWFRW